MAKLSLRLLGFVLLALAITIPSCQALFPRGAAQALAVAATQPPGAAGRRP